MGSRQAASARNIHVPQINTENVFLYRFYTSITVKFPLGSTRLANLWGWRGPSPTKC